MQVLALKDDAGIAELALIRLRTLGLPATLSLLEAGEVDATEAPDMATLDGLMVVWSSRALRDSRILRRAAEAYAKNKLRQVLTEPLSLPAPFNTVQIDQLQSDEAHPDPADEKEGDDVFISYARSDRAEVEKIAGFLRELGLRVWFDGSLTPGDVWSAEVNRRLAGARVVLICWSEAAVQSRWVTAEALHGRDRGCSVQLCLDDVMLQVPFNADPFERVGVGAVEHSVEILRIGISIAEKLGRADVAQLLTFVDRRLWAERRFLSGVFPAHRLDDLRKWLVDAPEGYLRDQMLNVFRLESPEWREVHVGRDGTKQRAHDAWMIRERWWQPTRLALKILAVPVVLVLGGVASLLLIVGAMSIFQLDRFQWSFRSWESLSSLLLAGGMGFLVMIACGFCAVGLFHWIREGD